MPLDHDLLVERLIRLQLTCTRDQPDSLLDEAAEKQLTLREAGAFLVGGEVARKNERRLEMAMKIVHFPAVRELADFDFKVQPSVDRRQIRGLATSRWVAHATRPCSWEMTVLVCALRMAATMLTPTRNPSKVFAAVRDQTARVRQRRRPNPLRAVEGFVLQNVRVRMP